jgi:hypothetical protein
MVGREVVEFSLYISTLRQGGKNIEPLICLGFFQMLCHLFW